MTKTLTFVSSVFVASGAMAAPTPPDPKVVTSITVAARMCELTEAGIEWEEKSPKILALTLLPGDLEPPTPKMDLLSACIFSWAYERDVTLEVLMKP